MEDSEHKERRREEVFSKAVRAGKRTYFFDVKSTKQDEFYLTITESKKQFSGDDGKFHFEKHKIFLYKEDFEKFNEGLTAVMEFVKTGQKPEPEVITEAPPPPASDNFVDVTFEDLKPEPQADEGEQLA